MTGPSVDLDALRDVLYRLEAGEAALVEIDLDEFNPWDGEDQDMFVLDMLAVLALVETKVLTRKWPLLIAVFTDRWGAPRRLRVERVKRTQVNYPCLACGVRLVPGCPALRTLNAGYLHPDCVGQIEEIADEACSEMREARS